LTAEMAARLKSEGKTLYQRLDELYAEYGCFTEGQISVQMPGEKGMDDMRALMANLRATPPDSLGGLKVLRVRDYLSGTQKIKGRESLLATNRRATVRLGRHVRPRWMPRPAIW
jgi:hypothetical protein